MWALPPHICFQLLARTMGVGRQRRTGATPTGPRSHCQDTSSQPGWTLSPLQGILGLDGDSSALRGEAEDWTSCNGKDCSSPDAKHPSLRKRFLVKQIRTTKTLRAALGLCSLVWGRGSAVLPCKASDAHHSLPLL